MIKVGKRRLLTSLALSTVLVIAIAACSDAALFGLVKSKSKAQTAVRHSLVVFPFDRDTESAAAVPEDFGASVADYLRTTLATSKGYAVYLYQDRLAPIRRAKDDNVLKDQDIKGPFFSEKAKVTKLAEILATDFYIVGSVESYTYNQGSLTADLTLKADLISAKTGKIVQEFMVGGNASAGAQALEEAELRGIAAGKAVEALREKILATSQADTKPVAPAKPEKRVGAKTEKK